MGRSAGGVTAIRLEKGDKVTGMEVVEPGGDLLVVTAGGYGKRTPLDEYPAKGRATGGVKTIDHKALDRIGPIVAARVVQESDDLTLMSAGGLVLRTRVKSIPHKGRATQGVRLVELGSGDTVAAVARVVSAALPAVEAPAAEPPSNGSDGSNGSKP
jgi:DNA gyrase subunit A